MMPPVPQTGVQDARVAPTREDGRRRVDDEAAETREPPVAILDLAHLLIDDRLHRRGLRSASAREAEDDAAPDERLAHQPVT
jgi:hypothetical protein